MRYSKPTIGNVDGTLKLVQASDQGNKPAATCRDSDSGQSSAGAYEVDE
jgi:hypothetical protein